MPFDSKRGPFLIGIQIPDVPPVGLEENLLVVQWHNLGESIGLDTWTCQRQRAAGPRAISAYSTVK